MDGLSEREQIGLLKDVEYLKKCCEDIQKNQADSRTRTVAMLVSIVLLLIGTVANLAITLAHH